MLGTQFTIYDNGDGPKARLAEDNYRRRELVGVIYVSQWLTFA